MPLVLRSATTPELTMKQLVSSGQLEIQPIDMYAQDLNAWRKRLSTIAYHAKKLGNQPPFATIAKSPVNGSVIHTNKAALVFWWESNPPIWMD